MRKRLAEVKLNFYLVDYKYYKMKVKVWHSEVAVQFPDGSTIYYGSSDQENHIGIASEGQS